MCSGPRGRTRRSTCRTPTVMYASIAAQRHAAPVYWYEPPGYPTGLWVLSKWEHQRYVGSHPELFCSRVRVRHRRRERSVDGECTSFRNGRSSAIQRREPEPGGDARGSSPGASSRWATPNFESLILADPPRHGQIRNILMKALRPSLVRSLKARIAEITDEFLDEIEPGAETDFVTTVGRIPAALMTELIGVPRDMRDRFIEMASAQMSAITIDPNRDAGRGRADPAARRGVPRLLRRAAGRATGERRRRRRPRQHHRPVGVRRRTGARTAWRSRSSTPSSTPARRPGRSCRSWPWRWPSTPTSGASSSSGRS